MLRRFLMMLASLAVVVGVMMPASARAEDPVKIKIGTLAPKFSPWGQVFTVWQKGIKERTGGKLELEFFWNGTQGDEMGMAGKLRNGQLDGAAMTATGLSQFSKSVLALQLPGYSGGSWAKVDQARDALKSVLDPEFAAQKMILAGTGDVGLAHIMSIGKAVKGPADIKDLSPFHLPNDIIGKAFLVKLGVPVQTVGVPEILPKLGTAVKVLNTPSLAAEQLQWSSKLTHINTMVTGAGVGGLVFAADKINALPADLKSALLETAGVAGKGLTARIRKEDAAAYDRLKKKLEVVEPSAADITAWQGIFSQVRSEVCGPSIKAEACNVIPK